MSQIRFLTRSDGWAFGPQLWATHNAGWTWTQIATGGLRVTALEARGYGCSRSGPAAPGPGDLRVALHRLHRLLQPRGQRRLGTGAHRPGHRARPGRRRRVAAADRDHRVPALPAGSLLR